MKCKVKHGTVTYLSKMLRIVKHRVQLTCFSSQRKTPQHISTNQVESFITPLTTPSAKQQTGKSNGYHVFSLPATVFFLKREERTND